MPHPLDSARERLSRADENIQNLKREIDGFLAPAPVVILNVERNEPVIADKDRKAFEELKEFIMTPIKPRFSVLSGEIIHHMRSAFDHLAWQLSCPSVQTKTPHQIEFQVFDRTPELCQVAKKKLSRFCRKVKGITSPTALARIENLQPYWAANPARHPLWLIHDMDRFDKHRELLLTIFTVNNNIVGNVQVTGYGQQMPWELKPRNVVILDDPKVNMKVNMSAQITFNEFSGREDKPIIPTLQNLLAFTVNSIESFASELA